MSLYGFLIIVAALLILVTAVVRLNDIKRSQNSKRWWVRRVGLLFVAVAMGATVASFFTVAAPYWRQLTHLLFLWGIALTWITTPDQPPWWKLISRYDGDPPRRRREDKEPAV